MILFINLSAVCFFCVLMIRRPPRSTRTDTLFPYTTLFRSSIRTSLSGVKKAAKLNVSITIPGTDYQNEWPIWVYPNIPDAGIENPEPDDSRSVRFPRSAEEALKLLAEGRRVLLNPDTADLQGVAGRFTQVFWSPVHFPNQPGTDRKRTRLNSS